MTAEWKTIDSAPETAAIMERLYQRDRATFERSNRSVQYLVWSEGKTDFGLAESWVGARLMAFWIGLHTWLRLDPQRIHIATVGTARAFLPDTLRDLDNGATSRPLPSPPNQEGKEK